MDKTMQAFITMLNEMKEANFIRFDKIVVDEGQMEIRGDSSTKADRVKIMMLKKAFFAGMEAGARTVGRFHGELIVDAAIESIKKFDQG